MTTRKIGVPKKAATKPKRAKAGPQPRAIELAIGEDATTEDVQKELERQIPGWADLDKDQRKELSDLAISQAKAARPVQVKLSPNKSGGKSIGIDGKCEALGLLKLHKAFSAATMDPVNARANELLKYLGSVGADTDSRYNAALSFIESMGPRDQAEVLLLVQMYVTHDAAIRALSQLGSAEWVPTAQTFGNLATKLLRTSQGQMETLARMRRGGEQVVRHIHVDNRGGQAVIAETVNNGGRENGKISEQVHEQGSCSPALLGADPFGNGVPIASPERQESVPVARRAIDGSA